MSNLNSMLYWGPPVQGTGVPMPETVLVEVSDIEYKQLWHSLDKEPLPQSLLERIAQAAQQIGYPLFLRGDLTSGKHSYIETCFVPRPEDLAAHVWALTEQSVLGPGDVPRGFAIRKLLDLAAPFTAFVGLPIAPERRYFVRDGIVQCHHPYWPEDALRFWEGKPPDDWELTLAELNRESVNEVSVLTIYAERLGAVLPGYWSVDFALDRAGHWWFIDAALGAESWHPEHKKEEA